MGQDLMPEPALEGDPEAESEPEQRQDREPTVGPSVLRRIRRSADLSQRGLAERLEVSQSTVARWETAETSPTLAQVEEAAALAGLRLSLVDRNGAAVAPMREDAAADLAGRMYPAHLDVRAESWWVPRDAGNTVAAMRWRDRSARLGIPDIRYRRKGWRRDVQRHISGVPDDHASYDELVAGVTERRRRAAELLGRSRAGPGLGDGPETRAGLGTSAGPGTGGRGAGLQR